MRKPEQSTEPSIEEILASICRIIADDGVHGKSSAADHAFPRTATDPRARQHSEDDDQPRFEASDPFEVPRAESEDEILELTEDFMLEEHAAAQERLRRASRR